MPDFTIHPTRKWVKYQYTLVFFIFCFAVFAWVNYGQNTPAWLLLIPAALFLWPMLGGMQRRFTKITVSGDKLRYETGILSRTSRTIQLSKVQDVRVDQTVLQRLVNIGTLSFETAGETSRLTMPDVDEPHAVSEAIVDAAQQHQPRRKGEPA